MNIFWLNRFKLRNKHIFYTTNEVKRGHQTSALVLHPLYKILCSVVEFSADKTKNKFYNRDYYVYRCNMLKIL